MASLVWGGHVKARINDDPILASVRLLASRLLVEQGAVNAPLLILSGQSCVLLVADSQRPVFKPAREIGSQFGALMSRCSCPYGFREPLHGREDRHRVQHGERVRPWAPSREPSTALRKPVLTTPTDDARITRAPT